MSQSQSEKIKEIVDELARLRKNYEADQAALRVNLCALFEDGPPTPQREIVKKVVDFFLFNDFNQET